MDLRKRISAACILVAAGAQLGGCITSEASRYEEKLTSVVKPQFQANDEVAAAFGLQPVDQPTVAVTALPDN
jgi:hypothetical protein